MKTGKYEFGISHVGGGIDNYYGDFSSSVCLYWNSQLEYLLKQYLQTNQTEMEYLQMYQRAIEGIQSTLIYRTLPTDLWFVAAKTALGDIKSQMDHSSCFLGGLLALGSSPSTPLPYWVKKDQRDFLLAQMITRTCVKMHDASPTQLAPEKVEFMQTEWLNLSHVDLIEEDVVGVKLALQQYTASDKYHVALRRRDEPLPQMLFPEEGRRSSLGPETVESLFFLWRLTNDEKYRYFPLS